MKKLYVLLIAMISVSALVAQDRGKNSYQKDNYGQDHRQPVHNQQQENYKDRGYSNNKVFYYGSLFQYPTYLKMKQLSKLLKFE